MIATANPVLVCGQLVQRSETHAADNAAALTQATYRLSSEQPMLLGREEPRAQHVLQCLVLPDVLDANDHHGHEQAPER